MIKRFCDKCHSELVSNCYDRYATTDGVSEPSVEPLGTDLCPGCQEQLRAALQQWMAHPHAQLKAEIPPETDEAVSSVYMHKVFTRSDWR